MYDAISDMIPDRELSEEEKVVWAETLLATAKEQRRIAVDLHNMAEAEKKLDQADKGKGPQGNQQINIFIPKGIYD